jgi:hypothetical protein
VTCVENKYNVMSIKCRRGVSGCPYLVGHVLCQRHQLVHHRLPHQQPIESINRSIKRQEHRLEEKVYLYKIIYGPLFYLYESTHECICR